MPGISGAIDAALSDMPDGFVIRPYLEANRVEVKQMLLTEYNEAETMAMIKEEGRAEGIEEGRAEGMAKGMAKGETRLGTLIQALISAGRSGDVLRTSSDTAYRESLYGEFGIA